jgi:hypothetical protein
MSLTESHIKAAIIQRFSGTTPEEVATAFYRSIHTWFPIISFSSLCERLPRTWEHASTDLCLLFMGMTLVTEIPGAQEGSGNLTGLSWGLESSYLLMKSWIAVFEGLGLQSLDFLHTRVLIVLFEVVHGIALAYISVGALFRAADVLSQGQEDKVECCQTWRGILILDR